tara:strand:- start:4444 stop:4830 length:387 start_codon:yes stop_codon:yes gene_type:complete
MEAKIKKKIPISSITLPFLYGFSGIVCIFLSSEIYSASFNVISVFNPEMNIVKIGFFHMIYAVLIRYIYQKNSDLYISLLPIFAIYEFGTFIFDLYVFSQFQIDHLLYTAVFHFGLFILLMYERRIFR